jgi:hypothetical protein
MRAAAAKDSFRAHALVSAPDDADVILFAEGHTAGDPYYLAVRRHPVWKRHRDRCFLYHDEDYVVPLVPGLFPALEQRDRDPSHAIGAPYMARLEQSPVRGEPVPFGSDALLFSFVGSADTHPIRREVMKLASDPRASCVDTAGARAWLLPPAEKQAYLERFTRVTEQSKFVLCPRGNSPSTYRLYETMEMGRAPVIISDGFTAFDGPEWGRFSLRVAEADVGRIPELLRAREGAAEEMGRLARRAWESWVAEPVCFHRTVEACASILRRGPLPKVLVPPRYLKTALTPFHVKNLLRWGLRRLRSAA